MHEDENLLWVIHIVKLDTNHMNHISRFLARKTTLDQKRPCPLQRQWAPSHGKAGGGKVLHEAKGMEPGGKLDLATSTMSLISF